MDWIAIRFHFGGAFVNADGLLLYVDGGTAESRIELDKLSFFEIKGHLADHFRSPSTMQMYWLKPGMELGNGLVLLVDDASCHIMAGYHRDGSIVDMYVEEVAMELTAYGEDIWAGVDNLGGDEPEASHHAIYDVDDAEIMETREQEDKDYKSFMEFYRSPSKSTEEKVSIAQDEGQQADNIGEGEEAANLSDDTSDEEYKQPIDENSSAEDEETVELRKYAKEIKKNIRAKKLGMHGSQPMKIRAEDLVDEVPNLDDPGSPYLDSSDDYSYEENSEGETERWKSMENKYDSKAPIPVFSLGMVFRCTRQFKKALVKYGLKTHKHLRFLKDEKDRVRAVCTWPGCKWLIYGSITSRSEWCKVVRFDDVHCCPPRRDNRLVTSTLIAKHYYQEIKDNPTWKVGLIKNAVQRDFLADVSISKCKRAKAIVLQQALDSMKGEYSRVYDYQLELLRSNPGSTIVVCLDADVEDKKVFERFYVCFDGCKKGFLAGCRKVIGLDGCWFKGANNGNLLCAIGRDANNQMYPVAWATVPIETYETWYWFIGLLQKDLNINNGGEGWVFISDQQKGLLKAVKELVPNAEHRMCARHIYANWRKKYTDKKLQKKWWRCAKSSCRVLFNLNRAYLAQDTPAGAEDMMSTSPEHWSRAFFRLGSNCDSVDNNMCESFNNSIMDARFYPAISMNEAIRKKVMVRIQENRAKAEKWAGTICPNIFKKLKMNIERSGKCIC